MPTGTHGQSRLDRLDALETRARARCDRRYTLSRRLDMEASLLWRNIRAAQLDEHVRLHPCWHEREGYGTCQHDEYAVLEHCYDCGHDFAAVHSHGEPTAVPTQRCLPCGTWHTRCTYMYHCYDCEQQACESHDCEGVESEPERPDLDWRNPSPTIRRGRAHDLAQGIRAVGVELECEDGDFFDLPYIYGIDEDGSLDNGVEVQTPPASGKVLVDQLSLACATLQSAGWSADSERCGTHVHLDMTDNIGDTTMQARLFSTFYAVENVLYLLQDRDRTGRYSAPLHGTFDLDTARGRKGIRRLPYVYHGLVTPDQTHDKDHKRYYQERLVNAMSEKYHESRYYGVNMHAIPYHGTLEIRIHEGTLDAERLLGWIDMLQAIVATVDRRFPGYAKLRTLEAIADPEHKIDAMKRTFGWSEPVQAYVERYALPNIKRTDTDRFVSVWTA